MDKKTKIIPLNAEEQEQKEGESVIVDALLSTLTDIDKELDDHLNPDNNKSDIK